MKNSIIMFFSQLYEFIIKIAFVVIMIINYMFFWIATSDVPIFIDTTEFKIILIFNFFQLVLNTILIFNSILYKKNNTFMLILKTFFLFLWIIILKYSYLYTEIAYYKFIVICSISCLSIGIIFHLTLYMFRTIWRR